MKEYLRIYSDFRSFPSSREAMMMVIDSLIIICESEQWKFRLSPLLKKCVAGAKSFPNDIALNFDGDSKVLSITVNKKKGFTIMLDTVAMSSIDKKWPIKSKILKSYMQSNVPFYDLSCSGKAIENDDLVDILKIIENRYATRKSTDVILSNIFCALVNSSDKACSFIESAFISKKPVSFINMHPLSYRLSAYREVFLVDDDFFNEIFGSTPEAMLSAANNIHQMLSTKDLDSWVNNNAKGLAKNIGDLIQINSNMITKGEWLQMADLPKAEQATAIIQRVTNEQGVEFRAMWNIDDKESRMMTVFDCNTDSDALVNIYTIELFPGKLTRPAIRKHELFLDNKFDLTLKEIQ